MRFPIPLFLCSLLLTAAVFGETVRPNIVWITSEDNGPELGCYGDAYATTPHIDALAKRGMRYTKAWSNAPVCAPARTTLISGMYPPSTGSEHMRSQTRLPAGFQFYPQYLRAAGYYCTNNSKEDYNLVKPGKVWDESSKDAHWENRADGQPFFAVFNHTVSHESQIRKRPHKAVHDPSKVRVPAYHPDRLEVRQDWAQYYDKLTEMDAKVGANLKALEEAGLAEDTIVFYYGDHGAGIARSKRCPYNSGLHVPLVLHVPEKFKHLAPPEYQENGVSDRLVSFVDLPATLLSIAGIKPPAHFHGHAFMGPYDAGSQPYIYGFRGRMDERYDLIRCVRDERYIYIRNYMPHKILGQYIEYLFQTPTTRVWRELYDKGELTEAQRRFWEPKPAEQLYDLKKDRDEIHNLADSPKHQEVLNRLRRAQQEWAVRIRDVGFLPEGEVHRRADKDTPYELAQDPERYPLLRILAAAELASSLKPRSVPALRGMLKDSDSAVRHWAALGLLMRGEEAVSAARDDLLALHADQAAYPRLTAAHALAAFGKEEDLGPAVGTLLDAANQDHQPLFENLWAWNALDDLGAKVEPWLEDLRELNAVLPKGYDGRLKAYAPSLKRVIFKRLDPDSDEAKRPKPKKKARNQRIPASSERR